ncbi:MAG: helix-turn-helix transcriptional regulator [Lachnospiraceae bacterium]|nr:helix-turn-helix transcriptional regulator [Lachnospiraceae bacterium]
MAVDKTLISGSMTMLLLKLLSEGDKYGYEMIDTLRQRSENVFELKAGTLYPLLHSMESKNLLTSYEKEVLGKTRKYYSITKEGRKMLRAKEAEWQQYAQAVANVLTAGV